MSILIEGMKLPQHVAVNGEKDTAYKCVILAHPDNSVELVIDSKFASPYDNGHKIQRYPITEITAPHGRLIDGDSLIEYINKELKGDEYIQRMFRRIVKSRPTVIEAEVSE